MSPVPEHQENTMDDESMDLAHRVALFRYGLIAELLHLERGDGLYAKLRDKADKAHQIPGTARTRVAPDTMRDWLKLYRQGGFEALKPRVRADRGTSRGIAPEVCDLLVAIKEAQPKLRIVDVIERAQQSGQLPQDVKLPTSTVHRLLSRHGLTGRGTRSVEHAADRRRFSFERAGQLWMSDVMHGPQVRTEAGRKGKAYLVGFLDDATRVVPYAAFCLSENTASYLSVFKQALVRRGIPERLYVDNGSAFRSRQLALVCAKLSIALVHARPYRPQGKGKQERWFRTVRMQLLSKLQEADLQSLEALNRRLWAWVEGEYHQSPHRGLDGETPLDRWAKTASSVRYPSGKLDLDDLFLDEARRRVHQDRTVSLHGRIYEVDPVLVGQSVSLRYDPQRPDRPLQVWYDGTRRADAPPVNLYANCFVKRNPDCRSVLEPSAPHQAKTPPLLLRNLDTRNDNDPQEER
jgi:transposase InsO family protein